MHLCCLRLDEQWFWKCSIESKILELGAPDISMLPVFYWKIVIHVLRKQRLLASDKDIVAPHTYCDALYYTKSCTTHWNGSGSTQVLNIWNKGQGSQGMLKCPESVTNQMGEKGPWVFFKSIPTRLLPQRAGALAYAQLMLLFWTKQMRLGSISLVVVKYCSNSSHPNMETSWMISKMLINLENSNIHDVMTAAEVIYLHDVVPQVTPS